MTTPRTAAGPTTKHGQYVLTVSKSWNWAAFDVTDIIAIEAEVRAAALDEARAAVVADKRIRTSDLFLVLAAIDALRERPTYTVEERIAAGQASEARRALRERSGE